MAKFDDLTGKTYFRWKVIKRVKNREVKSTSLIQYLCKCECGTKKILLGMVLRNWHSLSCGCWKKERGGNKTHGKSKTSIYCRWSRMMDRCLNPNNSGYHNYGGRGIKVSKSWMTFANFYRDMGDAPNNLTLERINNDKGYSKSNCKWDTRRNQNLNTRRSIK